MIFEGGQKVEVRRSSPAVCFPLISTRSNIKEMFKLPLLWFSFFTQVLYLTALLEVLSEYNLISILHWTAQRDLTCFLFFFFLPLTIALSLFSIYSLSLHLGFNTPPPPPPPPLFFWSKDGEYSNNTNFENTSLPPFLNGSLFPTRAVLSLSVWKPVNNLI